MVIIIFFIIPVFLLMVLNGCAMEMMSLAEKNNKEQFINIILVPLCVAIFASIIMFPVIYFYW